MYNPSAFLITTGALTSLFNFFFGEYYREREAVYKLWLKVFAYGDHPPESETTDICSMLESRERTFRQAKSFLLTILLTLIACFIAFQMYSHQYVSTSSEFYDLESISTYNVYTTIMAIIVLINALEMLYIQVAVYFKVRFPFVVLRRRVTGAQRLSMLWLVLGCPWRKRPEFNRNQIPRRFYKDLENPDDSFDKCFISREFKFDIDPFIGVHEDEDEGDENDDFEGDDTKS